MLTRPSALHATAAALTRTFSHARIRSFREVRDRPEIFVLGVRTPGENHLLAFNLDGGFFIFDEHQRQAPSAPSPFTMFVRKHVVGGVISSVEADINTRRLRFEITSSETTWHLHFETDTQLSNLYLCDTDGVLTQAADPRRMLRRKLQLGAPYVPPPERPLPKHDALPDDWPTDDGALWDYLRERLQNEYAEQRLQSERRHLRRRLRRAKKRAARRVKNVENDLARADEVDLLRHEADLLQSVQHRIKRGMKFVDVPDWNDENMAPRRIELDPAEPVQRAIASRYQRYRRLKNAEERILERLAVVEKQQKDIDTAYAQFQKLQNADEIADFAQRLERQSILPPLNQAARVREIARKPYREARSSDGFRILIGRTAKDNDTLSLHIARGRDLWMHARDVAGSHVIVWREGRSDTIPDRTLHEAATLAAQYSRAKNDTTVEVGYTERKHISKTRGAPPGSVSVAAMRTILVTPDEALCQQLFANAKRHRAQGGDGE